MNIEEILPELFFGEKRIYYCQRCLNHGLNIQRKSHKANCAYRFCACDSCQMVDRRRELNSRLLNIRKTPTPPLKLSEGIEGADINALFTEFPCNNIVKHRERRPNCQRCAQHFVQARLKGHKRCCPFKDCPCPKCQVVQERQKLMADQIKLRRKQKKQKKLDKKNGETDANRLIMAENLKSCGCSKCSQRASSYHQLLSSTLTNFSFHPALFSAILAAYPYGLPAV